MSSELNNLFFSSSFYRIHTSEEFKLGGLTLEKKYSKVYIEWQTVHYENRPMQHTAFFHGCKNDNFQLNFFDYFHIFAQNIEYPQSMFWSKNTKILYTPVNPYFTIQKWGVRGYSLHGHVFMMTSVEPDQALLLEKSELGLY